MPKVISVLEELEDFAQRFDSEGRELIALQLAVQRLELEKLDRVQDQNRSEKEFEQLEATWQSETRELTQLVERLKEENSQLKEAIKEKKERRDSVALHRQSSDGCVEEIQLMLRLKNVIDRQKVEIRGMRRQLAQKNVDLDAMQQQATRLAKLNAVLRRKHFVSKRQADQLLSEKNDLELMLQTKEHLIQQMREHVCHHHHQSNEPGRTSPSANVGMSASMIKELGSPGTPPVPLTESQLIERLNADDKMIMDANDSSRLHFTAQELRDLLTERNELKSRLIEVEEELSVYKRAG
ncbi:RILP protein 1 [Fasciola gigantica]|uniref:RILP protein 1 n=1 Tax=Fasciola gigantica TaxID=46835 RepID=A0A504YBQ2_FASGI|nr:RILP protein 1 [Fasciola gigantica]